MPQSLSKVYLHIVFSTKDRTKWIHPSIERRVHNYLAAASEKIGCQPLEINGMEDHLHVLLLQSRTVTSSKIIETLKSCSSAWVKTLVHSKVFIGHF